MKTLLITMILAAATMMATAQTNETWPAPVKGFVAPAAGEHPRLLFRKADVPALRQRAQTPEGKAIIARLKEVLGGGETMPTVFNPLPTVNILPAEPKFDPAMWTVTHGAGFGLLYQLTGQKKYADLARQCVEKTFAGQADRDQRYNWRGPGTGFRLGVVWSGVALAYDLCYDGWDDAFRRRVVREFLEAKEKPLAGKGGKEMTLEFVAGGVGYPPGSNHYGAAMPGAGLAAMAIRGDPGSDDARIAKVLEILDKAMVTQLTKAFGDHGWFAEGAHTARIASQSGVAMLIPAYRNALGKEWATAGKPHARYLSLRLMHEVIPLGGVLQFPSRGVYGDDNLWGRAGMVSHQGEFSIGFGVLASRPEEWRAMLWVWENFVQPLVGPKQNNPWDVWIYPHHAVWSFCYWPIGEKPLNPGAVLPRALQDATHGYYVFRNRWQDSHDIIVTAYLGYGPGGYHKKPGNEVHVIAEGKKFNFGSLRAAQTDFYQAGQDGSAVVAGGGTCLAVDFSKTSGAEALLAMTGPGAKDGKSFTVGSATILLRTAPEAVAAQAKVEGDKLVVGGQSIRFDGQKLVLEKFRPAP
jgi:hypothetical protein